MLQKKNNDIDGNFQTFKCDVEVKNILMTMFEQTCPSSNIVCLFKV